MTVKAGLRRPANIHCRSDVSSCPRHDSTDLVPVCHLFIVVSLHWSSGDDHSVELLVSHCLKIAIEHHHVFDGRVLWRMALEFHKRDVELKRRVGEQTHKVSLGGDLQRHEIKDNDFQRTNILCRSPGIVHNENILFL